MQYSLFPTSLGFPKCVILPLTLGMRSLLKAKTISLSKLALRKLKVFGVCRNDGLRLDPTLPLDSPRPEDIPASIELLF